MAEVSRLISARQPTAVPAPQRLLFAFDNLEALPAAQAIKLIEMAYALLGPACVGVVACNPSALLSGGENEAEALSIRLEKWFRATFNAQSIAGPDSARLMARILGANAMPIAPPTIDARHAALSEPLAPAEATLLTALAGQAASTPRGMRRFVEAYRLARLAKAPRPVTAMMLAVIRGGGIPAVERLRQLIAGAQETLGDPVGPPALLAAVRMARAANNGTIATADAAAAMEAARRYVFPS